MWTPCTGTLNIRNCSQRGQEFNNERDGRGLGMMYRKLNSCLCVFVFAAEPAWQQRPHVQPAGNLWRKQSLASCNHLLLFPRPEKTRSPPPVSDRSLWGHLCHTWTQILQLVKSRSQSSNMPAWVCKWRRITVCLFNSDKIILKLMK